MLASLICGKVFETYPDEALKHPDLVAKANDILKDALENPSDMVSLRTACQLMGLAGFVPNSTIRLLIELVEADDDLTRAFAATALCWVPERTSSALAVLVELLRRENAQATLLAAPVLALRGIRTEWAIDCLVRALPKCSPTEKCGVVRQLQYLGPSAVKTLPVLKEMLFDESLPSFFRARAAAAIGSVTKGSEAGLDSLKQALKSNDWQVVNGAADGLAIHGGYSTVEINRLGQLLESEDKNMRRIAILSLRRFGPRASAALPALLGRFGNEPDQELCWELTETVATIGPIAIAPLIELARRNDYRVAPFVAASLHEIGDAAIEPVIRHLLGDADERIQSMGELVIASLGPRAIAAAIPVLSDLLDATWDLEKAYSLVRTIGRCGAAAEGAAGALVNLLARCDNPEIVREVMQALRPIGESARRDLSRAISGAADDTLVRLKRAYAACQTTEGRKFEKLERINRDDLLKLFVLVGDAFVDLREAGWRRVSEAIRDKVNFKRANGRPFGMRDVSIAEAIEELSALIGIELVRTTPKKRTQLTEPGRKLLDDVKSYLESKYGEGR